MATFTKWVKQAIDSLVDPEKESRLAGLVNAIQRDLFQKKQQFNLQTALAGLEFSPSDLESAKEQVYRHILLRGWQDGALTAGEQQVSAWAANSLELSSSRVREINLEFARDQFSNALAKSMDDGFLDRQEESQLQQIAAAVGMSLSQFARAYFFNHGEGFLRAIFSVCVAENQISQQSWSRLLATAQTLGISHSEMLQAIQPQARRFVEHVLADAKSDGELTEHEDAVLGWLIANLGLSSTDRDYINSEVILLRSLTQINSGKLPSIPSPLGVAIRAGELTHFHGAAIWRRVRLLKSGTVTDDHRGTITMTNDRLVFTAPTSSLNVRYRSIVSYHGSDERIEIQTEGKPANTFFFPNRSLVPSCIFRACIEMANQTLVASLDGQPSRHIPRDVRQRIWQRYGGLCADCGAADYLEFDHIIPVAKGGSNSDSNVQLLCRRCNSKKSDHI